MIRNTTKAAVLLEIAAHPGAWKAPDLARHLEWVEDMNRGSVSSACVKLRSDGLIELRDGFGYQLFATEAGQLEAVRLAAL